ncbi:hypothetical protein DUI87_34451 [Hirundo rustica rustica]|uniref:ribonuclease H n=1 Tax=Hirundo rustica rustica TaxID=333673 RepID=A0A3M0IRU0_HIRRU|nr:hypothetical protein DUI87_34451 [Hirundo rustica rustica]
MPAIPEVEEQITPVVTKIGPYAIKKTGVQKLIVNPKWSLKRVEMGVQGVLRHNCGCNQRLPQLSGKVEKEYSLLKFAKLSGIMPLIWRGNFSPAKPMHEGDLDSQPTFKMEVLEDAEGPPTGKNKATGQKESLEAKNSRKQILEERHKGHVMDQKSVQKEELPGGSSCSVAASAAERKEMADTNTVTDADKARAVKEKVKVKEKEKEKEKETKPEEVKPPKQVGPEKEEAAAKAKTKETISEAGTAQASAKPEFCPTDWTDIKKFALKGDTLSMDPKGIAMPVTYDAHDANPKWERLDREVIRDLMKAIRDNGLGSPYFKQLLKGTFSIYDLTPFDLRSLATMILSDSQFILWEAKWRKILNDYRIKYQGGANAGFTVAQLAGDPPLDSAARQASFLPRGVLTDLKDAARKAMVQIPPAGVTESLFTDVKQGPSEPFASFIDRLTQAVDRQVIDEGVKSHLIRCLAFANANPECKRVISAMPGQPTMAEILEACSKSEDAIVVSGPGDDAPRFAFSIPSVNREEPLQRYHWVVLPQGLKNSPTICQWFVAQALCPAREKHPGAKIIHYMDDLLIAAPTQQELQRARDYVITEVQNAGLEISTSKIQEIAPWKYLGWKITEQTVKPQKIEIRTEVNNLQDLQQLLGEVNWMRSILGITNDELEPLFNLLKGDSNIKSHRSLTPEAREALEKIAGALQQRQAHRFVTSLPFFLAVLGEKIQLYGLIFQWDSSQKDPLLILEWIFLSYRSPRTILSSLEMIAQIIIKARTRLQTMAGKDFKTIYLPLKKDYFDWALQKSEDLQIALLDYSGVCTIHFPSHKLLKAKLSFREKPKISEVPLDAITVFTDGSGKTHKSAFASLGMPQEIKTDNGPTYIGKVLDKFLKRWGVHHTFGIPHSPTEPTPPIIRHFSNSTRAKLKENPLVLVRNPETGQIEGPFKLITWGKGYACVSTAVGPKWLAARHVKPYRVQMQAETDPKTGGREVGTQT